MSDAHTADDTTDGSLARARRAAAIVDELLELPEPRRRQRLAARCGTDAPLQRDVERWLAAAESPDNPLATSALVGPALHALQQETDVLPPGTRVGPWRLGARVGEGGMGVVHTAERADGAFEKRVALKVVHAALRSPSLIRQFARERALLARLEHPGIARLLDAGVTESGIPYLVMEHVDGVPITAWCDARRADVRTRVRLLRAACEAVQAAHALLVIHCDLKPGHLLVNGEGAIKLLDFGIAQVVHGSEAGLPAHDEQALYQAFTPAYASPEQRRGEPATIASDVYALGAVLHRLLTGALPHRGPDEPPAPPSARTPTTQPSSLATADAAAACGLTLRDLQHTLRGDLDAILGRALAKNAAERYGTVEALQRDLDAYLDDRAVEARPERAFGRAVRVARRHALAVSLATVAVGAILVGTSAAAWQTLRAAREARLATEVNDVLLTLLASPWPFDSTGTGTRSLRGLLDAARDRTAALAGRPDPRISRLRLSLASGYAGLGDVSEAARIADEVRRVRATADGPLAPSTLPARISLAQHAARAGAHEWALAHYDTALRIQRARDEVGPGTIAVLLQARARVFFAQGNLDAAERGEREVIALFDSLGDASSVPYAHAWQVLGQIQQARGTLGAAEASLRRSLAVREQMRGNAVETANVEGDIGKVRLAMGDHATATALLTRSRARKVQALGERDPEVADDDVALATVALAAGRLVEAEGHAARAAEVYARATIPADRAVQGLAVQADVALAAGDAAQARAFVDQALRRLDADARSGPRTRALLEGVRARIDATRRDPRSPVAP